MIRACIETLQPRRRAFRAGFADLAGIGISSPGPVNPWTGMMVSPPNLGPDSTTSRWRRGSSTLGLPAYLERDTNVAALGEQAFGAARGVDDFLYITVSTGVGGAIVAGGHLAPRARRDGR